MSSASLQNPDDPDATYRNKDGQKVHGYTTNLTETIDDNKPSLIVSVQTEPVAFSDCNFLQEAIENAERVTKETVKDVYADSAYQSPGNREFAQSHEDMNLKTGRMQEAAVSSLIERKKQVI